MIDFKTTERLEVQQYIQDYKSEASELKSEADKAGVSIPAYEYIRSSSGKEFLFDEQGRLVNAYSFDENENIYNNYSASYYPNSLSEMSTFDFENDNKPDWGLYTRYNDNGRMVFKNEFYDDSKYTNSINYSEDGKISSAVSYLEDGCGNSVIEKLFYNNHEELVKASTEEQENDNITLSNYYFSAWNMVAQTIDYNADNEIDVINNYTDDEDISKYIDEIDRIYK